MANFAFLNIPNEEQLAIPYGPTSERPANPEDGMMRLNTDFGAYEVYYQGAWLGSSYTFLDEFQTDTLASYNTYSFSTPGIIPTWVWQSSGVTFIDGENDTTLVIVKQAPTGQSYPSTGIVKCTFQKTADYPNDNNTGFYLIDESTIASTSTEYQDIIVNGYTGYYFNITGSAYTSYIRKYVNGVIVDDLQIAAATYSLDDETAYHEFEFHYSPTKIEFYADGTLYATLNISNTAQFKIDRFATYWNQIDARLAKLGVTTT